MAKQEESKPPPNPVKVGAFFGAIAAFMAFWPLLILTGRLYCKNYTVDACIPGPPILFGIVASLITIVWFAARAGKRPSDDGMGGPTAALLSFALGMVIWLFGMWLLGDVVCPDKDANDVTCMNGVYLGIGLWIVTMAVTETTYRKLSRR